MRMGSGSASWLMSSAGGPAASIVSSRPSTISCARGRSCSTRRAVNSRLTSRRTRVWSGGSMPRIDSPCSGYALVRATSLPIIAARLNR